jgi:hypothetical protein
MPTVSGEPYRRAVASAQSVRSQWILAAVSMALFCVQIDYFAMNLAVPRMAAEFDSSATDLRPSRVVDRSGVFGLAC